MQNPFSVITHAVKDYGEKLAELYGVSTGRFYQILEADFYGKTKRLIRLLATLNKDRVRLIKADLDALFNEVLGSEKPSEVDCAELHSELNDVIHAKLAGLPRCERLRECREAVSVLNVEIAHLEKEDVQENNFGDLNGAKTNTVKVTG